MASISTSLSLKDRFTSTLNKGINSIDRMLKKMNSLERQTSTINPAKPFSPLPSKIDNAKKRLDDFIRKSKEAQQSAEKVKNSWGGVGSVIKTATAAFGVKQIIDITDDMTSAKARLSLMNDGSQTDEVLQSKIMESAQRSRAGYLDTASAIAKLGLNAGSAFASNDETIAFMEQVNKLFVIGGASAQEQSNAMTQLTQAMAAGALRGEELNSILDAGPGIARAIEKYMGISEGSIKNVAEQGLVTADVVKNALFSAAEDTNEKFESMPKTFGQVWTQIKNKSLSAFDGIMTRINGFLNSDFGTQVINGILLGITLISDGVSWLLDGVTWLGNVVSQNWGIIGPILGFVAASLVLWGATLIPGLITKLWAMVAPVLAQAAAWALVNWPILLIAAAIVGIGILLKKLGVTFDQVTGFIGGVIGGLYAFMYNIVAGIYNYWVSFVEFFANCFNHPVYSVKKLFVNLANSVLDLVKSIASAIDAVFGSNLAGGIESLQGKMQDWLGEMPEGYKVIDKLEMKSIEGYASKGYDMGQGIGEGISDTVSGLFSTSDPFGGIDSFDMAESMSGANLGKVDEVGKINSDVNIADEDIKLLKDVAEMRYVQNFVTLQPSIAMNASVTKDADFDTFYNQFGERITEEAYATAEGYYG
jgi:tape measure domain-containing protein